MFFKQNNNKRKRKKKEKDCTRMKIWKIMGTQNGAKIQKEGVKKW